MATVMAMPNYDIVSILSTFIFQIGSRNLMFNFTDSQKEILRHPLTQSVILFSMFYVGTRSVLWALCLLLLYHFIMLVLINESHPLNVLPRSFLIKNGVLEDKKETDKIEMYYENLSRLPQ
jgi:hypothetical protein